MAAKPFLHLVDSHSLMARREAACLLTDLFVCLESLSERPGGACDRLLTEAKLDVQGVIHAVRTHVKRPVPNDLNVHAWAMLIDALHMVRNAEAGDERWRWLTVAGALRSLCEADLGALDFDGEVLPVNRVGRRRVDA